MINVETEGNPLMSTTVLRLVVGALAFVAAATTRAAESDIFADAVTGARRVSGRFAATVDRKIRDRKMEARTATPRLFLSTVIVSAIQPREH
jgi:hypothetical protein